MANLQLIKILAREKNISLDNLAKELNITPQGMAKLIRLNSTRIDTLERIAEKLKVSPCVFFTPPEEIDQKVVAREGSIAVSGKQIKVNEQTGQFLAHLAKKDEQIDKLLAQIDRLHTIIENITK
jgi:Helix-turn-helix.